MVMNDGSYYLAVQTHSKSSTFFYPAVLISSDRIQPFAFPVVQHAGLLDAKMKHGMFSVLLSKEQRLALSSHNTRNYKDSPLVTEKRKEGELVPILEAMCDEICQMDRLGVAYPYK